MSSGVTGAVAPDDAVGSRSRDLRVWALIASVAAAAVAVTVFLVSGLPDPRQPESHALLIVVVILLSFAVAELAVVYVPVGRNAFSLTLNEIPLVVGLFLLPPMQLVAARVLGAALPLAWRNRRSLRKLAFNLAHYALEAAIVVVVWRGVLGAAEPLGARGWLAVGVAVVASDLVGTVLIALAIAAHTGERPRLWSELGTLGPVAPLVNASFALVLVYVVSVDWRALWTVGVVVGVLFFAHRAHDGLRRRTESLEQLSGFTAEIGSQLDVESVSGAGVRWISRVLNAEVCELTLTEAFAGGARRWVARYDGSAEEQAGPGPASALEPWMAAGPLLVRRGTRQRPLADVVRAQGLHDVLAIRLHGDGEEIGSLLVGDRLGDVETFAKADLRELHALGNHLSVALRNARRADLIAEHAADQLRMSMHDELTGLPNRRHLEERAGQRLCAGDDVALALLDLDRFKDINDTLGHAAGDALLRMVADRLSRSVPTGAIVARLGSDEFAVLLSALDSASARSAASLLRHAFGRPFEIDELLVTVDASVGVTLASAGSTAGDLLRRADVAMCAAKSRRTGIETYRRELDGGSPQRLTLLTELKSAITAGALTVHFQPKVRLRDGAVVGAEALVRWIHPERGMVHPDEFIPMAEHSGLVTPLTMTVLAQALRWCETWRRAGWPLGVAVNMSTRSLLDPAFVDEVARSLAAVEVPSSALTLEITESSLMADPDRALDALQRMRELGLRLAIDDLGTGYSSLAYLQRLPVSEIKIDRSFLQPADSDADDSGFAIVDAVVELGHRLDREVVAEGVEDEATWQRLQQLGCDVAQGYWMSRPIPGEQILPWLQTWRPTGVAALRALT